MDDCAGKQVPAAAFVIDAERLGDDLARALFASSLADDEKMAWSALIPFMRLDLLAALTRSLESDLDKQIEHEGDAMLRVRAIMEQYAAKRAEIDQGFSSELSGIAKDLRVTAPV